MVVARSVNWVSRDSWIERRQAVLDLLSNWVLDWESLDHERYQSNYSRQGLNAFGRSFESWDQHKRWVNRNKQWVDVNYANLSIFSYPGEENLLLMQFEQSYRSDNYNVDSTKELYWSNSGGQWRIVYEGKRAFPAADGPVAAN